MTPKARGLTKEIVEQLIQMIPGLLDDPTPGGREITISINAERSLARIRTEQILIVRHQPTD